MFIWPIQLERSQRTTTEEEQIAKNELRSIKYKNKGKNDCAQLGKI